MTKPTVEEIKREIVAFSYDATLKKLSEKVNALEQELAAAGKMIEKLAAEGAVLREACGGDGRNADCPGCSHSQYIEAPEAPATVAVIAEFHAQGVEMFAEWKRGVADAYCKVSPGCAGESEARYAEREAKFYAQQLRAEASK